MAKNTRYIKGSEEYIVLPTSLCGANPSLCGLLLCSVKGKSAPKNLLDTDSSLHENVDGFYIGVKS